MLLEKYSVQNCNSLYCKVTSVSEAIFSKAPTVSQICKYIGDAPTEGYIELFLINLNETVSVANPLSTEQINFISYSIVNRFKNLTLADITLIFNNAKMGVYGSFYENLSPDKVITWFREYNELRMETCAGNSYNQSQNYKESSAEPRNSELTVKDFLKNIKK